MAAIPISYNIRNLLIRWKSTVMTALSIGLVVAVFIIIMSLSQGLKNAFVTTGEPLNVLVLRQGSTAETTSFVSRDAYRIIKYLKGIKKSPTGEPLAAGELTVLMAVPVIGEDKVSNVIIRGVSPESFIIHSRVRIVEGRMFTPGLREVIVSKSLTRRFQNTQIGDKIHIGKGLWTVVGHFDANRTAFDSEIWCDVLEVSPDFDRESFSSVIIRSENQDSLNYLVKKISDDPQLNLKALGEIDYYKLQTSAALPLQVLGFFLAIIMSIGSIFAAINTMYTSVANRTREIGTLRVLGFTPKNILLSFVIESVLLSLVGGIIGCALSLIKNGTSTHTANWKTFSEVAFQFRVTPHLMLEGLLFSVIIGTIGGLLPAISAARKPVIAALKEID